MRSYKFAPIPLTYGFGGYTDIFSEETMRRHYNIYINHINSLNNYLIDFPNYQNLTLEDLLTETVLLPSRIRFGVIRDAGGIYNHELFFDMLTNEKVPPTGILMNELTKTFGSFDNFKRAIIIAGKNLTGSGYVNLVRNAKNSLIIVNSVNHEVLLDDNFFPVLSFDIWEHAFINDFTEFEDYLLTVFDYVDWWKMNERYYNNLN